MFKGGYKASRICCEATTKKSIREGKPKKCLAKGYFTPTTRRYLCRFHGGAKSTDTKTRKYKGLYIYYYCFFLAKYAKHESTLV